MCLMYVYVLYQILLNQASFTKAKEGTSSKRNFILEYISPVAELQCLQCSRQDLIFWPMGLCLWWTSDLAHLWFKTILINLIWGESVYWLLSYGIWDRQTNRQNFHGFPSRAHSLKITFHVNIVLMKSELQQCHEYMIWTKFCIAVACTKFVTTWWPIIQFCQNIIIWFIDLLVWYGCQINSTNHWPSPLTACLHQGSV